MTDYWGYADWEGDYTHGRCRSNPTIINTGNPHMKVTINPIGTLNYNQSNTITGKVTTLAGTPLKNIQVKLVIILPREKTALFNVTTNANGVFTQTFTATRNGEYLIYAIAQETELYSESESEEILATTTNLATTTTITRGAVISDYVDSVITLTVTVKDENDNSLSNMDVAIYTSNNTLIAQRKTNSNGIVQLNYKLDHTGSTTFRAETIANTLYTGSTSNTINVIVRKHNLTADLDSSTVYVGWTARIFVQNENNKPTANTKFTVQVGNQTSTIISDEEGMIETAPLNATGNTTITITYAGNEKYNSYTKTFTVNVKAAISTQQTPKTVQNTQTAIPYKAWTNLSNMLVGGEGKYGEAGTGCTGSTALAGRNGSRKQPAPLAFSNLAYDIPDGAELDQITVYLKIRTLSCSSDSANIGITAPTLKLLGKSVLMNLPTSNGKLPYKEFGLVTGTLDLSGITARQLSDSDTAFTIVFPANSTTNIGRVQIDHVYAVIKYTPRQEG